MTRESLPADFLDRLRALEDSYCAETDPIRQSGFSGGPERWRAEREPILEAVDRDGDFLDIGCANGYLLQCLVAWAGERGHRLTPHGLDFGRRLVAMAQKRLPEFAANFHIGNAWDWQPPRKYRYVYSLLDCVPEDYLGAYCRRLLERMVKRGGKLIIGMYGSRSRDVPPLNVAERLTQLGFEAQGTAYGGTPPLTSFAWVVR
ncbi:MAG: class I SAM-dependent methyltransferase [Armatimonadota bacterium]|nr:MAG: class I SAM-dependent methyltransferase [Armatimonadota bacterium]